MPRVTIEVLAERLGLSTASVSYALNGLPGVSATTRTRVLELADELGWRPNVGARALSRARADAVGLLLPRGAEDVGAEPYYMALLAGIESGLAEAGTALMLRFVPDGADLAVYREWHAEHRVDGVFLTDLRIGDPRPALLDRLGLPYLVHSGHRIADGWRFGQELETSLLIDHLAGLGHRTLLHVAGPQTLVHEQERIQEVRRACVAAGIALTTVEADYTHEGAAEVVRAAVQRGPDVSAVLCGNDPMAIGCVRALREAGREHRVAVVSWDDSVLCETSFPSITALQRQPYETGRESARLLLSGLSGSWREPEPSSARLVIRETSVPA
ncbi:LacI family DNA-binding transcriptional regulator [Amnibacterium sp.]|uniref:LacI family DNA-binding transcriptional regulator n=1 Tax=Amnibacterium sp. TaxID=1872496 RepID=UPI002606CE05|nr:LacI family DNA-binding transcriptional regulator [Amnibacterium sp.]MCU1474225.1 LacI family transcriptional regulator [Amnibacterium sp.]